MQRVAHFVGFGPRAILLGIMGAVCFAEGAMAQPSTDKPNSRARLGFETREMPRQTLLSVAIVPVVFAEDGKPSALPPPTPTNPKLEKLPDPKADSPARPNLLDLDLDQLGKIQVRPSTAAPAVSAPAASSGVAGATTINPTQIDSAQGSTVAQLLDRAASVNVRRTSAINLDPRVRGFNSNQTNASADGMTQFRTRMDIDSQFSQINPGNVDSLNVIDGPYSVLYGPGFAFLAATLNRPGRYKNGGEIHGSASFSYDSNGGLLQNRERVWGGDASAGFDVSYGLRVGNDYRTGDGFEIPASYNQQDIDSAFSFDLTPTSRLDLRYSRMGLRNVELPGITYDIQRQTTDQFNIRYVIQEAPDQPERFIWQSWVHYTPYRVDATRESKQRTFFPVLIGTSRDELIGGTMFGDGFARSFGSRMLFTMGTLDTFQWTVGADWRRFQQNYTEIDINNVGEVGWGGNLFGVPKSSQDDFGVLTSLTVPVSKTIDVNAGARLDYVAHTLHEADRVIQMAPFDPEGYYRPGLREPHYLLGAGFINLETRPWENWRLISAMGYAMRSPNLTELYNDEPYQPIARFGSSSADGNPALKPERNLQFDVGALYHKDRWGFGVRGFHCTISDYILPVPSTFATIVPAGVPAATNLLRDYTAFVVDPNDPTLNLKASAASLVYRYTNIERATLGGVEITANLPLREWLALDASLAYVKGTNHAPVRYFDAERRIEAIKSSEALPSIYPLNSTLRFRAFDHLEQKWQIEFVVRMVGGQQYVADSLGELPTPGFTVFDLNASYQLRKHVRVFTSLHNLLNRNYTEHGSLVINNPDGTLRFVGERGFSWLIGLESRF